MSRFGFAAILVALVHMPATADTLYLTNGDRITGTIKSIAEGAATVETSFAGTITVKMEEVASFETDAPIAIRLEDGTEVEGIVAREGEWLQVTADGASSEIDPKTIAAAGDALLPPPLPEPEPEPKIWSGKVEFGATVKSGTTDRIDASTKLTLVRTKPNHILTLTASGLYGESNDEIDTRRYYGQVRWQYYPHDRWYTYTLTNLEHDGGKKLELRWGVGAGVGYDFISNDVRKWSLEVGLDYRKEWWNLYSITGRESAQASFRNALLNDSRSVLRSLRANLMFTPAIRNSAGDILRRYYEGFDDDTEVEEDLSLKFGSHYAATVFTHNKIVWGLTFRPETDEFGEYRAVSDFSWSTPLSESMALRFNWLSEYDSQPGQNGIDRWDNTFITALGYEF